MLTESIKSAWRNVAPALHMHGMGWSGSDVQPENLYLPYWFHEVLMEVRGREKIINGFDALRLQKREILNCRTQGYQMNGAP